LKVGEEWGGWWKGRSGANKKKERRGEGRGKGQEKGRGSLGELN